MSFHEKLIGTWQVLSWTSTSITDASDKVQPYTKDIAGFLIYTSDGYMSSTLQKPGTPKYTPGPLRATSEEYVEAAARMHGYHGPYFIRKEWDVDGEAGRKRATLCHHIVVGLPTNWHGETQVRNAEMWEHEGRLHMRIWPDFTSKLDGVERRVELEFRKKLANDVRASPPGI